MKRDKTICQEYEIAINKFGNVPLTIKRLIEELDTSSIYYEKNKKNLERAYRISSRAFNEILSYEVIY